MLLALLMNEVGISGSFIIVSRLIRIKETHLRASRCLCIWHHGSGYALVVVTSVALTAAIKICAQTSKPKH